VGHPASRMGERGEHCPPALTAYVGRQINVHRLQAHGRLQRLIRDDPGPRSSCRTPSSGHERNRPVSAPPSSTAASTAGGMCGTASSPTGTCGTASSPTGTNGTTGRVVGVDVGPHPNLSAEDVEQSDAGGPHPIRWDSRPWRRSSAPQPTRTTGRPLRLAGSRVGACAAADFVMGPVRVALDLNAAGANGLRLWDPQGQDTVVKRGLDCVRVEA
jgi:hypothetical protein